MEVQKSKTIEISEELRYKLEHNEMSEILPNLYLSGYHSACHLDVLRFYNISSILTVADNLESMFPDDMSYKTVSIIDEEEAILMPYFKECFTFIDAARDQS
jgi:hypothetical protein